MIGAGGFAAELRDDAAGLEATQRRLGRNPLGSAAGYGTPGLPVSRDGHVTAGLGLTTIGSGYTGADGASPSGWAVPGAYHWRWDRMIVLPTPISCRGERGLWPVPEAIVSQILLGERGKA